MIIIDKYVMKLDNINVKCQSKFILHLFIEIELTNAGSRLTVSPRTILIFVTFYNGIEKILSKILKSDVNSSIA